MEFLLITIFTVAIFAGLVLYNSVSWGYVCFKFWYWFLIPVFPVLPQIGFWEAVGLMFFISLFRSNSTSSIKKEYKDETTQVTLGILSPWLLLLMGYFFRP